MNIIIPGGSGLIGRYLAAELAAKGHLVSILSRSPQRIGGLPGNIRLVGWDGKTTQGWAAMLEETDAIVNLAGESLAGESLLSLRWTEERKRRILDSRLEAGKAIVDAISAAKKKPAVVLQVSAVGFYGPRDASPISEDSPPGEDFLSKVCVAWEQSTKPVEDLGVRYIATRLGVVLAAKGGALPRQMLPFKLFIGGPIGNGRQAYPWIHIKDVSSAMGFLLQNEQARGVFNLTAPDLVTNAEFGRALGKVMHRPAWIPAPAFAFKLAFGEASIVLLEGQAPSPQKLQNLGYQFHFPQVLPALHDLLKS